MSDQNQNQGRSLNRSADATQRRGTAENVILMIVYTAVILFALVIPAVQVLTRFFQILSQRRGRGRFAQRDRPRAARVTVFVTVSVRAAA